jgi:cyclomaltodextrinase
MSLLARTSRACADSRLEAACRLQTRTLAVVVTAGCVNCAPVSLAWVEHAIWWQIYPLGFVGAYPADPPPPPDEHRLRRIPGWFDHAIELGASGIALGPIFASRTHGYDTTDHYRIDPRLGDDADFDFLIAEARRRGLRVLLDGVFNHVGQDFSHPSWFRNGRNGFHTFEGHGELITLNHRDPEVVGYVSDVMRHWLSRGADGWRLDAAYAMPDWFWSAVIPAVRETHPDAWFVGEVIHGDYSARVRDAGFDSVTQYELWKAIWSALNDGNFHELDWALQRQNDFLEVFAPLTFVGNHDVTRIASTLTDPRHLPHAVVVLMTTGGIPSIYAGDEYGYRAVKEDRFGGDDAVRPEFPPEPARVDPAAEDVFRLHQFLIGLRRRHPWLHRATTTSLLLDNRRYVYSTRAGDESLLVALNVDDEPLPVSMRDLGFRSAHVLGGDSAPAQAEVDEAAVAPHGWLILRPLS